MKPDIFRAFFYPAIFKFYKKIKRLFVTIQPPPNQLANIDFDVIGTSDY